MSIVLVGSTSGSITLQEPAVAGTTVLDLPATSGTFITTTGGVAPSTAGNVLTSNGTAWVSSTPSVPSAGTGPAFNAYQSSQQNVSVNTWTKVNLQTEYFDTNNNFASSRFTPTVAGYYQINGGICLESNTATDYLQCAIYKNGANYIAGGTAKGDANIYPACSVSTVVYLNGSTDYVELYYYGRNGILYLNQSTHLSGALVRSA